MISADLAVFLWVILIEIVIWPGLLYFKAEKGYHGMFYVGLVLTIWGSLHLDKGGLLTLGSGIAITTIMLVTFGLRKK